MAKRILLVGGGTGGHVYPLVAVAQALQIESQIKGEQLELMMLGEGEFLKKAAEENQIKYKTIMSGKVRRYASASNIFDIFIKLPVSFIQSLWHLFWFMPDVVFAKGGHSSLMPSLAARLYLIPLYIHETDSVPGVVNKFLGKLAKKVFVSFTDSEKYFNGSKVTTVGNPTRVFNASKEESLKYFNLDPNKRTILVLGGSQGSKAINDLMINSLLQLIKDYQIIHQCGETQVREVTASIEQIMKEEPQSASMIQSNHRLVPFLNTNDLSSAYAACDVVIARAGSLLFEIAALGKPAIIIPLPNSAGDHQLLNATIFSNFGGVVLEEQNLTPNLLLHELESIFKPDNYQRISDKIRGFATPEAGNKIANIIIRTI